ncbi:hypothetical protein [Bacillus marinisedimentorum]|uniref:hypothetical protein n=1 Tax=Bacillus marinisedimentorum TaxID=1821260 RepID=UPI000871B5C5|nr:hypothetical protein [Bacillus marinisedimentorum]
MIPTVNAKTETNVKLPFSFIFYSLAAFIVSQILLLANSDLIVQGIFRVPVIWAAAHLLLLGWAVMVTMGAMYQLIPVVFLTPIWNERFGFVQFAVTAAGITSFAAALALYPAAIVWTGTLTLIGILMFLFQMVMTIKSQPKWDILHLFIATALAFLFAAIGMGIMLAVNLQSGVGWVNHEALLKTHILFGINGWFTLLIFGFSYKMVPMFSLSHGFTMKWSKYVYSFYMAGLAVLTASYFLSSKSLMQAGAVLLLAGFSFFLYHIKEIIGKRIKKKLDKPFMFSLAAAVFGWLVHAAGTIAVFTPDVTPVMYAILIYLYIMGWIIFSILGYLYKIVPFLWWTHRYSGEMGKAGVPALKDLINEKAGVIIFIALAIALAGISGSILFTQKLSFLVFQTLFGAAVLAYSGTVASIVKK